MISDLICWEQFSKASRSWTDQGHNLPLMERKINLLKNIQLIKPYTDIFKRNQGQGRA